MDCLAVFHCGGRLGSAYGALISLLDERATFDVHNDRRALRVRVGPYRCGHCFWQRLQLSTFGGVRTYCLARPDLSLCCLRDFPSVGGLQRAFAPRDSDIELRPILPDYFSGIWNRAPLLRGDHSSFLFVAVGLLAHRLAHPHCECLGLYTVRTAPCTGIPCHGGIARAARVASLGWVRRAVGGGCAR